MSNKSRLPHTIDEMFEESKNRLSLERESMIQNIKDDLTASKAEDTIQSMTRLLKGFVVSDNLMR